jgi:hypothetical protein
MKASQLLRGAARRLAHGYYDGKEYYICNAIGLYVDTVKEEDRGRARLAQKELVNYIDTLLMGEYGPRTLGDWADHNIPASRRLRSRNYGHWRDQMQAYRHRWVRHLIVEFESRGE